MKLSFTDITPEEFRIKFASEEDCLRFLAEKKWGQTYVCKKCGNTNYCKGKHLYSRRCTRCKYDESAKVGTLFEGCRFALEKAFYIAFLACNNHHVSTYEISKQLQLRQMTCWSFNKKIQECIDARSKTDANKKIDLEQILLKKHIK